MVSLTSLLYLFGEIGDIVTNINVEKGTSSSVHGIFNTSASIIIKKGLENNITQNLTIDPNVKAPISEGQKLGYATYTLNDQILATVDIVAKNEVKKVSLFNMTTTLYSDWFNMIRNSPEN